MSLRRDFVLTKAPTTASLNSITDDYVRELIYRHEYQSMGLEAPRPSEIEICDISVDQVLGDHVDVW